LFRSLTGYPGQSYPTNQVKKEETGKAGSIASSTKIYSALLHALPKNTPACWDRIDKEIVESQLKSLPV